ncbi:hypothetical protein [Sinorhizobium americanum]|uniref:Uncharacterized protein n=1 Tax=Sinorhizobium americanum TaxID=194963 RepID=A0A4R2BVJ2_9HYPH|nr:hypothetical protein [Sinorhizobium americanum]TCN30149.1 hypothetical protein EV184_10815 [Sinorhizobium americanum]
MEDLSTVQALIDAHQTAMQRYDSLPDGDVPDDLVAQMDRTARALCSYRPATLDGVHLKAGYMVSCYVFVGAESGEPEFTRTELISGFLPAAA